MVSISAKAPKVDKEATVNVDLGNDVQDAINKFGAEVVFSNFKANAVITAQSNIRRYLEKGMGQEEIQAKLSAWKPGVAMDRTVDPKAAIMSKFAGLSAEDKKAILEKLMA